MSFKGRINPDRREFGLIEDVTTLFEENIFEKYSVENVAIVNGMTIEVYHDYDPLQSYNYRVYIVNSAGSILRLIGDYTTPSITHTIIDATAAGVAFVANDNPSGTYKITWDIRIIDGSLIDNPVDVIKHIKKLQNWSELGVNYNWGKEEVQGALIKTSGEGSFNSSTLDEIKTLKIARQIFDYDRAWSDDLVQSICEQFFLVSYQDENGYECIKSLLTKENPSTTITFGDIVGTVGDMVEPRMSDIYCAPIINYAYDYATEKYTKQLRVDYVWESTFSSTYCPGIEAADAEDIWNECHSLWNKVRQIEPMPSNLTDRIWIPDYDTALWCLQQQLKLMTLKRCSFSVGYTVGRKWDIGKHFKLQLPHETNNHAIECVVEEIVKKKDSNLVTVQVILLDVIESSFFFEE